LAESLARGEIPPQLVDAERVMLEWTGLLTLRPADNTAAHVEALREAGWDDEQIAEAAYVTAMFAFFNRVADAFGLEDPGYAEMAEGQVRPATRYAPDSP